jgi:hypothetical protein
MTVKSIDSIDRPDDSALIAISAIEKRIMALEETNYSAMLKKDELALNKEKHQHEKDIAESQKERDIEKQIHDLKLEEEKHKQGLQLEKEAHDQATKHKELEFRIFTSIKVALSILVVYYVYILASRTINYVGTINTVGGDVHVQIAVVIAGISSSVILLVLLMKGVFGTKTETTTSDIPIGAVIKAIMAAFKSSGKS